MEKKTILAIVLSALVFIGFNIYTSSVNKKQVINEKPTTIEISSEDSSIDEKMVEEASPVIEDENEILDINFKTDLFDVTFDTKGANIKSLKLLNFNEEGEDNLVDLVNQTFNDNALLDISLGNYEDPIFDEVYKYKKIDNLTYEFSKNFTVKTLGSESAPLTIIKKYTFLPNDYMFELKISIKNSENSLIPINKDGTLYSLRLSKQIGPNFKKLDRRQSYRRVSYGFNAKRKELKIKKGEAFYNEDYTWAATEGKFFTVAIIPENNDNYLYYTNRNENNVAKTALFVNRNSLNSSVVEDTYKIYAGPKDNKILKTYNKQEDNLWKLSDTNLNKIIHYNLRPIAMFSGTVLQLINSVVKNYGISIILLTILIKMILYPFTKKSIDSMGKMQTIQPEIKKLQEKYKDDNEKLNIAMQDLYKKEGVNPLGGCLPMLLQMPIFIAFYSLFNEYIGLREAAFIPGWINDLSKPEYILQFGFKLPVLGWDALRLLPIIYVVSQLVSMKFSQNKQSASAPGASAMQTKMLTLGMPIIFFFIMYDQSSGLLIYWITQNLISSAQQILSKKKSDKQHDLILEEKANKKKKKRKK